MEEIDYRNYTYDNIGQLKTANGFEADGTARLHEKAGYSYDAAGNLNWRTNNALIQNFAVNNLNELTTATRSGTFTVAGTTTSPATNVTVNTTNAAIYADTTFAAADFVLANGLNTFIAIAKDALGRVNTNSVTVNLLATNLFAYDLNGNMTSDGQRDMDYDDENQLIRVTVTKQFKKEYTYDGANRLRVRKEYGWTGSAWAQTNELHFICDGVLPIQERNSNNVPLLTFTRGIDLSGTLFGAGGIGGLLAMTEANGVSSFYHSDGNGNITALVNVNQILVGNYVYDSFGRPLSMRGLKAFVNPMWFSSQIYDWDTGFVHYPRRVYVPALQRWLNPDPLGEAGGVNLYGFVGNNPINGFDPYGLFDWGGAMDYLWGLNQGGIRTIFEEGGSSASIVAPWLRPVNNYFSAEAELRFQRLNNQVFGRGGCPPQSIWSHVGSGVGTALGMTLAFQVGGGASLEETGTLAVPRLAAKGESSLVTYLGKKATQMSNRGWTQQAINETVNNPFTTRVSSNLKTGNPATAFFNKNGSYIVRDSVTGELVQGSNLNQIGSWIPDKNIIDPYIP